MTDKSEEFWTKKETRVICEHGYTYWPDTKPGTGCPAYVVTGKCDKFVPIPTNLIGS